MTCVCLKLDISKAPLWYAQVVLLRKTYPVRAPRMHDASRHQAVGHGDDARDEDQVAGKIDTLERVLPRRAPRVGDLEEEQHRQHAQAGEGDVEVENPAPVALGDGAADDGPDWHRDACRPEHHAQILCALAERHHVAADDVEEHVQTGNA